jgi:plasmid stabilization system protein ParE
VIQHNRRRVVWSSAAEQEVADAAVWYEDHQAGLGEQFLISTENAANAAATSPELYARVHGRLRRVLVHRFPYALIVRESNDELFVVACYHLHRDAKVWQSRG